MFCDNEIEKLDREWDIAINNYNKSIEKLEEMNKVLSQSMYLIALYKEAFK